MNRSVNRSHAGYAIVRDEWYVKETTVPVAVSDSIRNLGLSAGLLSNSKTFLEIQVGNPRFQSCGGCQTNSSISTVDFGINLVVYHSFETI